MDNEKKIPLLAVVGPTASGKTALAIRLAKEYGGEIVSADSMQVYRGMQIATAKPTPQEMQGIPHHLMDFLDPGESFSVADYAGLARQAIREISARGKLPILAGGTGLYVQAVVDGIQFSEEDKDMGIRRELEERVRKEGASPLLAELSQVDPEYAAKLHPNNEIRVIRAMEIYLKTGIPMSRHQENSRTAPPDYRLCMLGLNYRDRAALYDRINRRVDQMMVQGLLEEARRVCKTQGLATAYQAIGYKELAGYFQGEISLEEAVETIKRETRRYAKRQLTWFRRDQRIRWIYPDEVENFEKVSETSKKIIESSGIL